MRPILNSIILILFFLPNKNACAGSANATVTTVAVQSLDGTITGAGMYPTGTVVNVQIQANSGWYLSNVTYDGPPGPLINGQYRLNPAESWQKTLLLDYQLAQNNHVVFDPTTITNFFPQIYLLTNCTVTAWFTVLSPTINQQPTNQVVAAGENVVLAIGANGRQPIKYQWQFNGQNIAGATNATLTLNSVGAGNSGGYSAVVRNPYGSISSFNASLAVLTDGANGNQPAQLTCPIPPSPQSGQDSLVVVTHGFLPSLFGSPNIPSWVTNLASDIQLNKPANWMVVSFDWTSAAWGLNPEQSLVEGKIIGTLYGQQLSQKRWQHVHLIGHSAGAAVIQSVADQLKTSPNPPVIQMTFLDPFLGIFLEEQNVYGQNANWSDCYFTQDWTGGFTSGNVNHCFNVDVDWTDPHNWPLLYGSNLVAFSTHEWSHDFYIETVTNSNPSWCANNYGFHLSAEGGGEANQVNYPIGNGNYSAVLCGPPGTIPTPILPQAVLQVTFENVANTFSAGVNLFTSWFTLSNGSSQSLTQAKAKFAGIQPEDNTSTNSTGSPAWLAVGVAVTNIVNFVQFDADFTDTNVAEGLLTVYWNTNQVGMVDERVVSAGLQTYHFTLPGTMTNGLYTLSFRLDSFDNTLSSITVTNVATGFIGVMQPMILGISLTNGSPVLQLTSASNFTYIVQSSTNLVDWTPMALLLNTNGVSQFTDFTMTNSSARFYRAVMP